MANEDTNTQEIHLFIDFDNKLRDDVFQNKFFFRVTNLEKETPLVQVNDHLFKGKYSESVGTNLFFKDVEKPQEECPFEPKSTIFLEHKISQYKVLTLTPVKIPSKVKDIPEPEYDVQVANYEYQELLKKLANGSLNLEDTIKIIPKGGERNKSPESEKRPEGEVVKKSEPSKPLVEIKEKVAEEIETKYEQPESEKINDEPVDILTYKYEKLKQLARRPTKRKVIPQPVAECESKYQKAYEYNCMKSQVIMPSDYFPVISKKFNRDTLVGAVDIDRSILQGFIEPSTEYCRILTEDGKAALLSMENMHNLSMPARYWVLKSQLEYLESLMLIDSEELSKKDNYGRTIEENVEIYRRLIKVVSGIIEEKYFYNSECETDDGESSDENLVMDINVGNQTGNETMESQDMEDSMEI